MGVAFPGAPITINQQLASAATLKVILSLSCALPFVQGTLCESPS